MVGALEFPRLFFVVVFVCFGFVSLGNIVSSLGWLSTSGVLLICACLPAWLEACGFLVFARNLAVAFELCWVLCRVLIFVF